MHHTFRTLVDGLRTTGAALLAALSLCALPVLAQSAAPVAAVKASDSYRIGAGDTIRITVYQSPDLSLETRVTEAGVISFPLVGRVAVGGLSINEAETELGNALRKGEFVKNPQVIIVVTQVRASQANVLGQVAKPGRVALDVTGMRLTEVLALAGGVVAGAGSDTVVLIGKRDGQTVRHEVDLPKIFAREGGQEDLIIMPGDSIWVDRAPQVYLYGEVQRPGQIRLERGMTVMQALATAGGLTQRGTLKGLQVQRQSSEGGSQAIEPGMTDLLRAGDVMFVRESLF
ncbi:MAG: polysaccharide export protein EpsE [Ideonella sp.]